jgi:hypothetical protein
MEHLFIKGRIFYVEKKRRSLAHIMPKIKKLCVVQTYADMKKLLVTTMEVEKVLGKIKKTPIEPLKEERDEEANEGESSIKW